MMLHPFTASLGVLAPVDESCAGRGSTGDHPCQHSPVLLLHSPCPGASHCEPLLAVFMPSGTSAAHIWFISYRSLEQSAWVSIPYTSAHCLQLPPGFLHLSLQRDDLVQSRLPHEHHEAAGLWPWQGGAGLPLLWWACRAVGSSEPLHDQLWSSGRPRQRAGTEQGAGRLCRAHGIGRGVGATAEDDGVVLLVASHSAPAVRNWPWDDAFSPCFGGKGWIYVGPLRALHPRGCGEAWLLRRTWEEGFLCLRSCCGKGLFSAIQA